MQNQVGWTRPVQYLDFAVAPMPVTVGTSAKANSFFLFVLKGVFEESAFVVE